MGSGNLHELQLGPCPQVPGLASMSGLGVSKTLSSGPVFGPLQAHSRFTWGSRVGLCPRPPNLGQCAPSRREVAGSAAQACLGRPALLPGRHPSLRPAQWPAAARCGSIPPRDRRLVAGFTVYDKSRVPWPNRKLESLEIVSPLLSRLETSARPRTDPRPQAGGTLRLAEQLALSR